MDEQDEFLKKFGRKEGIEVGEDMEPGEVLKKIEDQGGEFVLLAVSPESLKMLKEGEEKFDSSNPVVSGKTLAKLFRNGKHECEGCDGNSCLAEFGIQCSGNE